MLTLEEVLSDVSKSPGFDRLSTVTVNSRGDNGQTPLHWMATLGDVAAIELLLSAGADVNVADRSGDTPLHAAIQSRQVSAARCLVNNGADCHAANRASKTPIDLAREDTFSPMHELFADA
jgi:ankyrin repeat protein